MRGRVAVSHPREFSRPCVAIVLEAVSPLATAITPLRDENTSVLLFPLWIIVLVLSWGGSTGVGWWAFVGWSEVNEWILVALEGREQRLETRWR